MQTLGLLLLSIVPSVVLFWYFYQKDILEHEPKKMLMYAFFFGVLAIIPAVFFELALGAAPGEDRSGSFFTLAFEAFIAVALVEEGVKYLIARFWVMRLPDMNEFYDGILYTVCVALGFATLENIIYVLEGGVVIGIARAFLTVPMHALGSVIMGYYISSKKFGTPSARFSTVKAIGFPLALHGTFNFILSTESLLVLPLVFIILACYVLFIRTLFAHLKQFDGSILSSKFTPTRTHENLNGAFETRKSAILFWLSLMIGILAVVATILILIISYLLSTEPTAPDVNELQDISTSLHRFLR